MRHNNNPTLKFLDRLRKRINTRHIQMVRRLVQQKDMRVLHRQLRKDDTVGAEGSQFGSLVICLSRWRSR